MRDGVLLCDKYELLPLLSENVGSSQDGLLIPTLGVELELDIEESLFTWLSRTTSSNATMFGPPDRFWRILISLFIFFFLTGFRTLMTHFW